MELSEDYLSFEVEMEGDGFLIDSDQYYQGWTAAVDGVETPIYQVNGFMRGIEVPAGSHRVEFRYSAPVLRASLWVCLALFLLVFAALGLLLFSGAGRRFDARSPAPVRGEEESEEAVEKKVKLKAEELFPPDDEEERKARARSRRRRRDI